MCIGQITSRVKHIKRILTIDCFWYLKLQNKKRNFHRVLIKRKIVLKKEGKPFSKEIEVSRTCGMTIFYRPACVTPSPAEVRKEMKLIPENELVRMLPSTNIFVESCGYGDPYLTQINSFNGIRKSSAFRCNYNGKTWRN